MIVYCVRIGDKYGPDYEQYVERMLKGYDIRWIREPYDPRVVLQWNKMLPMSLDIDEPICVIDIDLVFLNDYRALFETPVKRGEFLAIPGWWRGEADYSINGGFFKYYPADCRYIYDKFMSDPWYWQRYYIENGTTVGPVNGEQYFVEDSVNENLKLKLIPDAWVTRWATKKTVEYSDWDSYDAWSIRMNLEYMRRTGNKYCVMGGDFHPDIKLVHFTNSINKPDQWEHYEEHIQGSL